MFDDATVFVRLLPRDIHYLNRIFEGYEYLGVVSSIDKQRGIVAVRATPGTADEVRRVLDSLPVRLEILDKEQVFDKTI
jgi:hypothetical protein